MDLGDPVVAVQQVNKPPQPGPSNRDASQLQGMDVHQREQPMSVDEKAAKSVIEAENAKAAIFPRTGNVNNNFQSMAMMDEEYLVIGGHVDESIQQNIIQGDYVDFGKILPRDKIVTSDEDSRLELVIKNGKTFWLPVSESVVIANISCWEQAFRIYSNVYTRAHPQRSAELIQYNHIIHTIAGMYIWDNIYNYDKEFRMHMAKHPDRNWAIILQQAWAMKLRDRIHRSDNNNFSGHTFEAKTQGNNGEVPKQGLLFCIVLSRKQVAIQGFLWVQKCPISQRQLLPLICTTIFNVTSKRTIIVIGFKKCLTVLVSSCTYNGTCRANHLIFPIVHYN